MHSSHHIFLGDSTNCPTCLVGSVEYRAELNLSPGQSENPNELLRALRRSAFPYLARIDELTPRASHGFRFDVTGRLFDGVLSARVFCDAMTGVTGGSREHDPIVAHLVVSGALQFTQGKVSAVVLPGQICIRDTKSRWDFSVATGTEFRVVSIPRHLVLSRIGSPSKLDGAYTLEVTAPQGRFLENFLETIESADIGLNSSLSVRSMTRDICTLILANILTDHSLSRPLNHPTETLKLAKEAIEKGIECEQLTPTVVAETIGVSLRTLHRAFSASGDSVMAYIRHMRLQRAHDDLMDPDCSLSISEIAARWHFSDASHFIKSFKPVYGETPAVYLKNARGMAHGSPGRADGFLESAV
ncbi:helix-turn-helix domain-containing protein (plasmid) [Streptomyces sp. NBC_01450]|uniref:helix-turn-helix domain-containing protein n=1 Tax=Streptomyces sp. NBC_01450 TaxID=2903871 RepID=UPI002E2F50F3|nr:helix-turn-helix domain-containing protein [Streptomyces sp. NBC_01450]